MSLLIEAVDGTCSEKEASVALGLPDQSYWTKVKRGERPAPRVDKLTELPEPTQRVMCAKWAQELKLRVSDEDSRKAAVLDLIEAAARALREIA